MSLQVTEWHARCCTEKGFCVLPFDSRFNGSNWNNRMPFKKVGKKLNWEVFVSFFGPQDPNDPSYPHFAELHDNDDLAILEFTCKWSQRAGIQWGEPGSAGPLPTRPGRRSVRVVLLNQWRQPLLSQSGDYYLD